MTAIGHAPALAMLLVVVAAGGCQLGGISRSEAIDIATQHGAVGLALSAEYGPLGRLADPGALPEEPRTRMVWAVNVRGRFPFECPLHPGMKNCPPDATSMLVVLDFKTGDFLFSEAPAP